MSRGSQLVASLRMREGLALTSMRACLAVASMRACLALASMRACLSLASMRACLALASMRECPMSASMLAFLRCIPHGRTSMEWTECTLWMRCQLSYVPLAVRAAAPPRRPSAPASCPPHLPPRPPSSSCEASTRTAGPHHSQRASRRVAL